MRHLTCRGAISFAIRIARRPRALPVLAIAAVVLASRAITPGTHAVELPPAGGFALQTNGAIGGPGLGDWYTTASGGAGYHYVTIVVPCGWPVGTPLYIDLFSPEMNQVAGALGGSEEPNGNYDSTQFELYGPGASVGPSPPWNLPAPGTGIAGTQITYEPGAPGVAEQWVRYATLSPVTCGTYVLRSAVLASDPLNPAGEGNDQNGWRLRVGSDDDNDPTTAPPANTDNPDGVAGSNDEIIVGFNQVSFQQDTGGAICQTLYEYVDPGEPSVTFNNFDMDGGVRVRYYAPSEVVDPNGLVGGTAGTVSGGTVWNNGGTLNTRVGDTIANPESGWWRVVSCESSNNQFIQEGQPGAPLFFANPPVPQIAVAKDDGQTQVNAGQTLTYTLDITNTAVGANAGAANSVVATDTLPSNVTFQSCSIVAPATGFCVESAGVVTATLADWIDAGATAQITIAVQVGAGASGSVDNSVAVSYTDALGNPFAPVAASDSDLIATPTATATPTDSATATPTGTATATPTDTATATPTGSATATPTDSATATPTGTATATPTDAATATPTGSATATPTDSATATPTGTATATPTDAATATPSGSATATPTDTATGTPTGTATATPTGTITAAPTGTPTASPTSGPSATATPTSTMTPTGTATSTATQTAPPTLTQTSTITATPTGSPTPSTVPSVTATSTPTLAVGSTSTPTSTASPTPSVTPSATASSTVPATVLTPTATLSRPTPTSTTAPLAGPPPASSIGQYPGASSSGTDLVALPSAGVGAQPSRSRPWPVMLFSFGMAFVGVALICREDPSPERKPAMGRSPKLLAPPALVSWNTMWPWRYD